MNEKFELSCFQIITYVGTARTHFINAIHCQKVCMSVMPK